MRKISTTLGLLSIAVASQVTAQSSHHSQHTKKLYAKDSAAFTTQAQSGGNFLNNIFNSTNRPDWLTNTHISYAGQRHNTPIAEVMTTQPFYMDCWSTYFGQARVANTSGMTIGNLGVGYRVLTDSNQNMWGLNAFVEETTQTSNARTGFGGELFTPYLVFRGNMYFKLSDTKTVSTSPGAATYERALNGYDLSMETPFPYVSWMRIVVEGYRFPGNKTGGANGGDLSLRVFPARQVEFNAGVSADNNSGRMGYLKLDYYFGSPDFIQNTMTTPNYYGAYAPVNVEKQRLQKVIRHNDIVVEKANSAAGESTGSVRVRGT